MPISKPRKGEKRGAFVSRCMSEMKGEFPSQDVRLGVCFSQWRKKPVSNNRRFVTLRVAPGAVREETFNDAKHLAVPVVALVEGVLRSATTEGPELALATEFGHRVGAWNGRPVTIGHPKVNGEFVSASESPETLEKAQVGQLFNFRIDNKTLKGEAWIELNKGADLIRRLKSGEQVEVSTSYFIDWLEMKSGEHEGEKFSGIQRGVKPDHLAFLGPGEQGACSWADGCGAPRVNGSFLYEESPDEENEGALAALAKKLLGLLAHGKDSNEMDKGKFVDALIANEATRFTKDQKGWLMSLEEDQLAFLEPPAESEEDKAKRVQAEHDEDEAKKKATAKTNAEKEAAEAKKKVDAGKKPETVESFIAAAPAEIGEMLQDGLDTYKAEHGAYVKALAANELCTFTEDELKEKKLDELRKLAKLAQVPDFTGGGGPRIDPKDDPDAIPAAPDVWDLDEIRKNQDKAAVA